MLLQPYPYHTCDCQPVLPVHVPFYVRIIHSMHRPLKDILAIEFLAVSPAAAQLLAPTTGPVCVTSCSWPLLPRHDRHFYGMLVGAGLI